MRYRQVLNIVSSTLSLTLYPDRKRALEALIIKSKPDWEDVVKVSSSQYVLPAFYLNLARFDLLHLLPEDLCLYLELIVEKNKDRNLALMAQADELKVMFATAGIDFLFLKGMANLRSGLYEHIAERMMGDIDLIVAEADMEAAVRLLLDSGYEESIKYDKVIHRDVQHYPRLRHPGKVGGLDVHRYLMELPNQDVLPFGEMFANSQGSELEGSRCLPSYEHLLIHNVLNVQVHDRAHYYGDIHLRHLYDLVLLSKNVSPQHVFEEFGYFGRQGAKYFCLASKLFDFNDDRHCEDKRDARFYVWRSIFISNKNSFFARILRFELYLIYRIARNINLLLKAIINRDVRKGVLIRLIDVSWYKRHLKSYRKLK